MKEDKKFQEIMKHQCQVDKEIRKIENQISKLKNLLFSSDKYIRSLQYEKQLLYLYSVQLENRINKTVELLSNYTLDDGLSLIEAVDILKGENNE